MSMKPKMCQKSLMNNNQNSANISLAQWLARLETGHSKKIDLGLQRVKQVYENLAIAKIAPTIITVAGTNGKGSTVAILSAICQQAGYKVGEFTSPHLLKYNERIKINSQNASDEQIVAAFSMIETACGNISLSYFEYATLAAAIIFKQEHVDIAILEVGLGGRLDSVNTIDTDCAVITTIDIDHCNWLGDSKEAIGYEKAGIMRAGKPAIYGDVNCPQSIIDYAKKIQAELNFVSDFTIKDSFSLNIAGDYQIKNVKTAILALKSLNQLQISDENIQQGLKNIQLFARLQIVSHNPEVIVDVSHNQQAAIELSNWLQQNPIKGKTIAVFAVLADKKPINWLHYFQAVIAVWCISQVDSERAMPTNELLQALAESAQLICSFDSVSQAYEKAKIMAEKDDRIIVFGSFYTVSEVLATLS